jgi:two-component system LytT family response regulator
MKALIVEDEVDARKVLIYFLQEFFPDIHIIGEAATIVKAKQLIEKHNPDLLFLDVRLEDGTAIELLEQIEHHNFQTIFTTAYDHYAIKAIKFDAVDYLLKPINPEEFKQGVLKAIEQIKNRKETLTNTHTALSNDTTISIKTSDKTYIVPINNIIHLMADGAYTTIITEKDTIVASKNLKYFETVLPADLFIRTHQSHLINTQHIQSINRDGLLQLSNNNLVPVAFRKKSLVRNLLKK